MSELELMFHQAVELFRWDGAVDPLGIVIRDDGAGSELIVLNFALPLLNQYKRKYAYHFSGFIAAPVAITKPPHAYVAV